MKNLILTLTILQTILFTMEGQTDSTFKPITYFSGDSYESDFNSKLPLDSSSDIKVTCGLEVNRFTTNSGFQPGLEFSFFVKGSNGRRSLELAGFYDTESRSIAGFSLNHKYMFLKKLLKRNPNFEPYLFYNLIYRSTTIDGPLTNNPKVARQLGGGKSTVSSLEHHIGLGLKMKIRNSIYLHYDVGYGRYLGSVKKPTILNENSGLYKGGNGWGLFSKFGVGVDF
jgi:hypothetical protein